VSGNPARPAAGTVLCALAELPDPGARGFMFRDGEALFLGFVTRVAGAVTGWVDSCPHAGMPLAVFPNRYLTRQGDLILCASHGALFRPEDGVCVGGPCAGKALTPWGVRVEGASVVADSRLSKNTGPKAAAAPSVRPSVDHLPHKGGGGGMILLPLLGVEVACDRRSAKPTEGAAGAVD
jgi:nitrite reductase/ring-hydroxylating ferredoxin subunit